jgi:hypothetical protein
MLRAAFSDSLTHQTHDALVSTVAFNDLNSSTTFKRHPNEKNNEYKNIQRHLCFLCLQQTNIIWHHWRLNRESHKRDCHPPWCPFPKDLDPRMDCSRVHLFARPQFGRRLVAMSMKTHCGLQIKSLSCSRFARRY